MFNQALSHLLTEMGDLLELNGDNPFRIRAFRRAAETIEAFPQDLSVLTREEQLAIPGIGKGIADLIEEFKTKKIVSDHEKLKQKFPAGVLEIMNLPGLGAKRAGILFKELHIDSVTKLRQLAEKGKIKEIAGFGEKMQDSILKNISFAQQASKRMLISDALQLAAEIKQALSHSSAIHHLEMAGSARRWKETVGDLDFLCTSSQPDKAIADFLKLVKGKRVLAEGSTKASVILENGFQCDFRVVPESCFGATLLYFTGSKQHNVLLRELAQKKGLTLNEYGLFKISDKDQKKPLVGKTEEEVYKFLGLPWIAPELREDRGEIEAGLKNKLPNLIEEKDVLGDFHNHTELSDGAHSLEDMVKKAQSKNWKWFFSADHSPSLTVASGLPVPVLKKKMAAIKKLRASLKNFGVYCSSEVDILGEGKLDYPDEILKELDCVVGSVHSRFKQSEQEMTERICKAIKHPYMDILGHISGRLINRREGYAVNYETILQTAKQTQTAIEINGQPDRAELSDVYVKRAIELGVPLALNTDAHSTQQLDNITLAVHIARRGWAEPKHIINTKKESEIVVWLKR